MGSARTLHTTTGTDAASAHTVFEEGTVSHAAARSTVGLGLQLRPLALLTLNNSRRVQEAVQAAWSRAIVAARHFLPFSARLCRWRWTRSLSTTTVSELVNAPAELVRICPWDSSADYGEGSVSAGRVHQPCQYHSRAWKLHWALGEVSGSEFKSSVACEAR